jgi:hypothetical protein
LTPPVVRTWLKNLVGLGSKALATPKLQRAVRWLTGSDQQQRHVHRSSIILVAIFTFVVGCVYLYLGTSFPSQTGLSATVLARSVAFNASATTPLVFDANLAFSIRKQFGRDVARLRVENVESIDPPIPDIESDGDIVLEASSLSLTGITVARGASFGLTLARGDLLRVQAGQGSFTVIATEPLTILAGGRKIPLSALGAITFRSGQSGQIPMLIVGKVAFPSAKEHSEDVLPPLLIENVPITTLRFGHENGATDLAPFVSSIESGSVTLDKTSQKLKLEQRAALSLSHFDGMLVSLELGHDGNHVIFTGSVDSVALGPAGFSHDVTPSKLDIFYHIAWLRLACGAILAMLSSAGALLFVIEREKA